MRIYNSPKSAPNSGNTPPDEKIASLRTIAFFAAFSSDEHITKLLEVGSWFKFSEATFIIREGEVEDMLYVVISGKLRVFKNKKTLAVLQRGEIVGEMGSLLCLPRCANVITLGQCTLFAISVDSLKMLPQEILFPMMRHIYGVTANRLVDANRRLAVV